MVWRRALGETALRRERKKKNSGNALSASAFLLQRPK